MFVNAKCPGATSPELSPEIVTTPAPTLTNAPVPLTVAESASGSDAVYSSVAPEFSTSDVAAARAAASDESDTSTRPSIVMVPSTAAGSEPADAEIAAPRTSAVSRMRFIGKLLFCGRQALAPSLCPVYRFSRMGRHHQSLSRYHCTVLRMPVSKLSDGRQPSSSMSFDGSIA